MRTPRGIPRQLLALLALIVPTVLAAQGGGQRGQQQVPVINQTDDPLLRGFQFRSIGPAGQGGRVNDFAVDEKNPLTFYVGFATAGLWKTDNHGVTIQPIFDTYGTHSIGDLAIAPSNPNVLYVGTGENNNRQSSSFGDGIYKTTDAGRTFTNIGLRETQTISRIVVHPTNPDIVWVAANGHLFGPNPERGVFKSTSGGRSWSKTLYVDENTGATDIVIDPSNPNTLFAATYQRQRSVCCFVGGGPGSGIWRSDNGGDSWSRVSGGGLPNGTMGRIGLDFARSNPNVIYAQIEVAQDKERVVVAQGLEVGQRAAGAGRAGGAGAGEARGGGAGDVPPNPQASGVWRSNDKGRTWQFQSNTNNRPMYYSQIRVDPNDENTVYVGGASASKSTDGGKTFTQLQGFGHGDHHAIWIDPNNSKHVLYGNDGGVDVSWDGAQTWQSFRHFEGALGQPYHVSVDMRRPYYVCTGLQDNGSWCGPSSVRSNAILSQDWYRTGGGDGFQSAIDPTDFTVLYTESQDGNMSRLNLREGSSTSIRPRDNRVQADGSPCPGQRAGGGGGRGGGAQQPNVTPAPGPCTIFRFNWNTPLVLSPHNPSTIYVGGNRLFISKDRGQTWSMTPDLTKNIDRDTRTALGQAHALPSCGRGAGPGEACIHSEHDGIQSWGNLVSISESPVRAGVLWVGSDDGNLQVSRDNGATWTEVGKNIPGGIKEYYARVEASRFDAGTAYAAIDGHRSDDLKPYVYVTRDYGQTWTSITSNLPPLGNVNNVRQDPKNKNLLYAATEFGFFVSLDEGRNWRKFMANLPVVRVDEVVIHPRDSDLVLATHGRSIKIVDDITPLQQMTPEVLVQDVHLFAPREAVLWKSDTRLSRSVTGAQNFRGQSVPTGASISYFLRTIPEGDVRITITDPAGQVFRSIAAAPKLQGLNRVPWNLQGNPQAAAADPQRGGGGGGGGDAPTARPGAYRVTLTVGGREFTQTLQIVEDTWMEVR